MSPYAPQRTIKPHSYQKIILVQYDLIAGII
jgi:hypothetical protein